uniref:Squamous cell carcinoma antigen recognized by T-cells 3 n=2 Tax=Parascaris TaxID=6254 RepID=A0A915ARN0_PARUN
MSDGESSENEEAMAECAEEVTDEQIATLQAEVIAQPNDYDKRIQLIALLRAAGELDALRAQREATSEIFAMPPKFWMEWIDDEKTCESDKEVIRRLFERAIGDFHSPEVIVEYVQWACGISIDFARQKMEEAVSLIGLRADCASIVWGVYLDFEKVVLQSLNEEEADKHRILIDGIYARFLRIPHIGIEHSWSEYETFAEGKESEAVKTNYQAALRRMPEIASFEKRLEDDSLSVEDQLNILSEYIEMEIQVM